MRARGLGTSLLAVAIAGCAAMGADGDPASYAPSSDEEDGDAYFPAGVGSADGARFPSTPLTFDAACDPGDRLTIAAVGDVLLHAPLQRQAYASPDRHVSLFRGVSDLLAQADVTYANLEGPAATGVSRSGASVRDPGMTFDDYVYTSYPQFNYHRTLIEDLRTSGVDVVSTANNHSLDRHALGVDRTIEALDAAGMPFTGTRPRSGNREWYTLVRKNGFTLAWLACTFSTNGISDREDQVLYCFRDEELVVDTVRELAARGDVDAVIVTPHWGDEYHASPNREQVRLAHRLLDAGALAILGAHPHVLQPWEKHLTPDGRETFVIYSLGNFVSGQSHLPRRSTMLLYLGLTRGRDRKTRIHGARYVPLHMSRTSSGLTLQAIDRTGGYADSRALTVAMFGEYNVLPPGAPLVLDPQCDPEWQLPHPHDGWIGGSCEDATECGGALCMAAAPGGLCTDRCSGLCPDAPGRVPTFCADLGYADTGFCLAQCISDGDCRSGYRCVERSRFGGTTAMRRVCAWAGAGGGT